MLKDISTIKISYSKSRNDNIASDFYLPCLKNAIKYDRATGYFGSTIYYLAWNSLKEFVINGGIMRIICSPYLAKEDRSAIAEGLAAHNHEAILNEFIEIFSKEHLSAPEKVLACLIAMGKVQIRIAIGNEDPTRLFHDKIGIFSDGNDSIAFRGSMNETFKGLSEDGNFESLSVYTSWKINDDERCSEIQQEFDNVWNSRYSDPQVISLPDTIINTIKDCVAKGGYRWEEALDETIATINNDNSWCADKSPNGKRLRKHQSKALNNWEANARRGIFEHATGSGKTFTAMCAIRKCLEEGKKVLVIVPSVGLMHQWKQELCKTLADLDIVYLLCGTGNNKWKSEDALSLFTNSEFNVKCVIIAVADTAASLDFLNRINNPENLLIVGDEVHSLGSVRRRNIFSIDAIYRLGLSATPYRYNDPEGTNAIISFFGKIVEPKYTLEQAIKDWVLCRYFYFPHVVELTDDEQNDWNEKSKEIKERIARHASNEGWSISSDAYLQMLIIKRARILKGAQKKIDLAYDIIKTEYKDGQRWIIYCDDQKQMDKVSEVLAPLTTKIMKYHSEMNDVDKSSNLRYFSEVGGIIISIKCLDEGIDIPKTSHALILASSQNPREYIQRRGRILRNSENKRIAYLHDAIVIPNDLKNSDDCTKIVATEISRALQFGSWSNNKICIYELQKIALANGIELNKVLNFGIENE